MRKEYKDQVADKIAARYISLEERILQDIARRIKKTGEITSTADWQINRLRILGYSSEDIEREIKKTLDASYPEMFELYDKVIDWEYVRNKDIYEQINAEFIPYEENRQLQQITDAVIQQSLEDLENVTKSLGFYLDYNGRKILTPLSQVYTNYLDNACFDVVTGAFDYGSVLRRVVTQLTNSGLRKIEYGSGYASRVEVAARRAVMTGVANLTGEIADYNAKKLGTEYFEVEWHAGARPAHSVWQGRVWTKEQLYSVCGLGTVTGLLGANCYHTYYPFFPGISERNWSDDWLEEQNRKESKPKEFQGKEYTLYEAKQRQRQMETAMRAQREKVQMLQDGGADRQEVMLQKAKYQGQLNEYAAFSRKMRLKEERERIYIDGRGRIAPSQYDLKMRISIPDTVAKKAGLSKEIEAKINAAIKKLDSEYVIYLDSIKGGKLKKNDIFATGAYLDENGMLRHGLVLNYKQDYRKVETIMPRWYNDGVMAGKNFEDYIAHEMAHIMPFQNCVSEVEYIELNEKIRRQFIAGISEYADRSKDGRECLAEAFVRYRNGEWIPDEARKLIRKYILHWRRV
ncbi:phage minor capsid protein [Coprococcus comes]|jgi:hypothetical protein|uniref:phage minor capsid protein n=1 Tax=Coprococcus comes TaxID=410072 RepID=UPI001FAE6BEE|nr:phage minor capsid protein [Coprococcus comes]DAO93624.1 MAG TPA: minor capsid protein [Caudoviricetes sp.]